MTQRQSLHIGLNHVDPNCYGGWDSPLISCENDANDLNELATTEGFSTTLLLRERATAEAVVGGIERAAQALQAGDLFLISYSGHGGQVKDIDGDEADRRDETWCLYNRQLLDDELKALWAQFRPGVRILLLSDSCHSGTVHRDDPTPEQAMEDFGDPDPRFRDLSEDTIRAAYVALAQRYKTIQRELAAQPKTITASVRLLAACQEDQRAAEKGRNGYFTRELKKAWAEGAFQGGYNEFFSAIVAGMPRKQTPNHQKFGDVDGWDDAERPFAAATSV